MPNLTITIPHQLSKEEAKRRIGEQAATLQSQQGGMLERVEQRWDGDTLHFHVGAAGQSVSGSALFSDQSVHLDIALPWMLSLLAGTVKKQIEQQGHKLLGHNPKK
ncbi:MAG TPA: polyhydroxyalkanoic acid system family protein [Gemmataceae bacterium]|nr:polyhydroxyalkanoic acid system family protein [Gemmataceae bacterium]